MTKNKLILLCINIVLIMAGYGIFMPIIPHMIKFEGIDPVLASMVLSVYAIGQFISSPLFGKYADINGSKKTLVIGCIGYFISLAITLLMSNIYLILFMRFVTGLFAGAGTSSIENYISKMSTEEERPVYYTFSSISIALGMTIGPVFGFIYFVNQILISSIMLVVGLGITMVIIRKLPIDQVLACHQEQSFKAVFTGIFEVGKHRLNRYILLCYFLFGLITAGLEAVAFTYAFDFLKPNAGLIIFTVSLGILLAVYVLKFAPKLINKVNNVRLIRFLLVVSTLGILLATIKTNPYIIVTGFIILTGALSSYIIDLTTLITTFNDQSGTMLGARNSAMSIGSILGPIITSSLYKINPSYSIGILAIACVCVIFSGIHIKWRDYE